MTWLAPAALAGALFVALPILIHMMGRGRTTVIRFPSLRFLESSRLLPARRTRIHALGPSSPRPSHWLSRCFGQRLSLLLPKRVYLA